MFVLNKFELDVMQPTDLPDAVNFAIKYCLPSMVVSHQLVAMVAQLRGRAGGRFKIISPIDWHKGSMRGIDKFRDLPINALDVDGYEILISPSLTLSDTAKEISIITEFVRKHIGEHSDLRYVVGSTINDQDQIGIICQALAKSRNVSMIRNDTNVKMQVGKANLDTHRSFVDYLHSHVSCKTKVSGNISTSKYVTNCPNVDVFAVSLAQARLIVSEMASEQSADS